MQLCSASSVSEEAIMPPLRNLFSRLNNCSVFNRFSSAKGCCPSLCLNMLHMVTISFPKATL